MAWAWGQRPVPGGPEPAAGGVCVSDLPAHRHTYLVTCLPACLSVCLQGVINSVLFGLLNEIIKSVHPNSSSLSSVSQCRSGIGEMEL